MGTASSEKSEGCRCSVAVGFLLLLLAIAIAVGVGIIVHFAQKDSKEVVCSVNMAGNGVVQGLQGCIALARNNTDVVYLVKSNPAEDLVCQELIKRETTKRRNRANRSASGVCEPRHYTSASDIRIFAASLIACCDDTKWNSLGGANYAETELSDIQADLLGIHRRLIYIVSLHTNKLTTKRKNDDGYTKDYHLSKADKAIQANYCPIITEENDESVRESTVTHGDDAATIGAFVETTEKRRTVRDETTTKVAWDNSVVNIDKSETKVDYEEMSGDTCTCSINDTLEKDSNATDEDIASFSDLLSNTDDDITPDALNEQYEGNQDKCVPYIDDDEDDMWGIFGVYTSGQAGVNFIHPS